MTEEQKEKRKQSANSGKIKWIKDNYLRTKEDDDDFVFISYKSDDYERVLDDIVYNTCKKYGLKVYFDTAFDDASDSWITQYYENMCDPHCKAFIAFIDNAYYSSYACLLEMMSRKTWAAGGDYKKDSLFFLPINLEPIKDIVVNTNTGLGTSVFSNGKKNIHAGMELKQFNEVFNELANDEQELYNIYKRSTEKELYEEKTDTHSSQGKVYLNETQCRRLMEMLIPKSNENDGKNKDFVEVIHDKLLSQGLGQVFSEIPSEDRSNLTVVNDVDDGKLKQEEAEFVQKKEDYNLYTEGYKYTIFGKEYFAEKREQGKLMFDAFEALTSRHPECAEKMTQRTSVAKAENVENPGTKDAKPVYFKGCKEFNVNGQKYLVGTSYGIEAKISEIKGMFKICGESLAEFVLNGKTLGTDGIKAVGDVDSPSKLGFVYKIFDKEYMAENREQGKLMFDAFEALTSRHPECAEKLTQRTSIAKAEDVENPGTKYAKPVYFKGCKEFNVNGQKYLVGTSYGIEAKISEIKGMFKICDENFDQFVLVSQPEKDTRKTTNKKGIGELL